MLRLAMFTMMLFALLLTACGGGGGDTAPASVPTGKASGTALDGLIFNGTITAYDFTTGAKGAQLAQTTTNATTGLYSLSLQVESRPILLEITGGYYNEESAATSSTSTVTLDPTDKLTGLFNYKTGESIKVSVTAYTHLAAGLAKYKIKNGTAVASAIDEANQRISTFIGFDVLATSPLEITDIGNASASATPSLQYGFLAAGISQWVSKHAPTGLTLTKPYISIRFDQTMHDDIAADGLLDGQGFDQNSNPITLSFGTTALGPNVYRQEIGAALLEISNSVNNKTGLTPTQLLSFAQAYAGSTDPMFNGVAPLPVTTPTVSISSPTTDQWVHGTINVVGVAQDYAGLSTASLAVDANLPATITTNLTTPTFPVNTTNYAEGSHTLALTVLNVAGLTSTATVPFRIDNTPPTLPTATISGKLQPGQGSLVCHVAGSVADSLSGPSGTITAILNGNPTIIALINNTYTFDFTLAISSSTHSLTFTANDNAGNTGARGYSLTTPCTAAGRGCLEYSCVMN